MHHPAHETTVGRPRKYKDEPTSTVAVRVPLSVRKHLEEGEESASSTAYDVLLFEKDLSDCLEPVLMDLRMSAAMADQDYSEARAETLCRLIKLGLSVEKKSKK